MPDYISRTRSAPSSLIQRQLRTDGKDVRNLASRSVRNTNAENDSLIPERPRSPGPPGSEISCDTNITFATQISPPDRERLTNMLRQFHEELTCFTEKGRVDEEETWSQNFTEFLSSVTQVELNQDAGNSEKLLTVHSRLNNHPVCVELLSGSTGIRICCSADHGNKMFLEDPVSRFTQSDAQTLRQQFLIGHVQTCQQFNKPLSVTDLSAVDFPALSFKDLDLREANFAMSDLHRIIDLGNAKHLGEDSLQQVLVLPADFHCAWAASPEPPQLQKIDQLNLFRGQLLKFIHDRMGALTHLSPLIPVPSSDSLSQDPFEEWMTFLNDARVRTLPSGENQLTMNFRLPTDNRRISVELYCVPGRPVVTMFMSDWDDKWDTIGKVSPSCFSLQGESVPILQAIRNHFLRKHLTSCQYQQGKISCKNMRGLNADGINFAGLDVGGVDFTRSNMTGAINLSQVRNLRLADFSRALFKNMELTGVSFRGAQLKGARFMSTCLRDSDFSYACLDDTSFDSDTILEGADLTGTGRNGEKFTLKPDLQLLGMYDVTALPDQHSTSEFYQQLAERLEAMYNLKFDVQEGKMLNPGPGSDRKSLRQEAKHACRRLNQALEKIESWIFREWTKALRTDFQLLEMADIRIPELYDRINKWNVVRRKIKHKARRLKQADINQNGLTWAPGSRHEQAYLSLLQWANWCAKKSLLDGD